MTHISNDTVGIFLFYLNFFSVYMYNVYLERVITEHGRKNIKTQLVGYGSIFILGSIFLYTDTLSAYSALNDDVDQACNQKVSALCPADGAVLHPDPGRTHPGRSLLYRKFFFM